MPAVTAIVINLDRDADRLAHMQAECTRVGLALERFPALRGDALPEELKRYFDAGGSPLSKGEIGCYASHLALHQRLAAGALPSPALILEDDIRMGDDFAAVLDALLAKLPREWDMVRLSNAAKRAYAPVADLAGGKRLIRYSQVPTSTGAQLVSASGARKFLREEVRRLPIDQDLRRVWHWKLDMYGVTPNPITPDVLQVSSIDTLAPKDLRKGSARRARLRRQRWSETLDRHAWNMELLGVGGWAACEWANVVAAFTPRKKRAALYAQARTPAP